MEEKVPLEDLFPIREARMRADLAIKEVELCQMRLFMKYQLREGDQLNMETGAVVRAKKPEVPPPAPPAAPSA